MIWFARIAETLTLSAIAALLPVDAASPTDPYRGLEGAQVSAEFDGSTVTMSYRYFLPDELVPDQRVPLILYLHSAGRQGTDNEDHIDWRVTRYLADEWQAAQKAVVLAPQVPSGRWVDTDWSDGSYDFTAIEITPAMSMTIDLVETFVADHPFIDPDRIYVLGTSMGGFGVWNILLHRPGRFAAAVPVEGGGDPALADRIAHVPVWAWHGDADSRIPVEASREMIAAMEEEAAAGGLGAEHIRYTELPGVNHSAAGDAFTPTTDAWFLAQRRDADDEPPPEEEPTAFRSIAIESAASSAWTIDPPVVEGSPDGAGVRFEPLDRDAGYVLQASPAGAG